MKSFLLALLSFVCMSGPLHAQEKEEFRKIMTTTISQLMSTTNADEIKALQNTFERIGKKEPDEWLPHYYAAFALIRQTWFNEDIKGDDKDLMMDKADELVRNAENLAGNTHPELLLLKSMIASVRIAVNPMVRGRELGPKSAGYVQEAAKLDPGNPRVSLLQAQSLYYTPEMFGGDKKKAKQLFEKTIEQSKVYQAPSELHPNWGADNATYFLSLYSDKK